VSPERLAQSGVSVSRIVQSAGEFVVVFPQSFTASVACGFSVSESLHLAPASWFPLGCAATQVCMSVCLYVCVSRAHISVLYVNKKVGELATAPDVKEFSKV